MKTDTRFEIEHDSSDDIWIVCDNDAADRYLARCKTEGQAGVVLDAMRQHGLRREHHRGSDLDGVPDVLPARERHVTMKKRHAMQPVVWDGNGVVRFQANPIVRFLLDWASGRGMNLNDLTPVGAASGWSRGDWEHFAQLHGYSVSGWGDLNYVRDATYDRAQKKVEALLAKHPSDPTAAAAVDEKGTDR